MRDTDIAHDLAVCGTAGAYGAASLGARSAASTGMAGCRLPLSPRADIAYAVIYPRVHYHVL
eukprot:2550813-Rhodomonas_salina.4